MKIDKYMIIDSSEIVQMITFKYIKRLKNCSHIFF